MALVNNHRDIVVLASVLRLQTLVQMGSWDQVQEAANETEHLLGLPGHGDSSKLAESAAAFAHLNREKHETAFLVYALTLAIVFYTHTGDTAAVEARTKVLHEMLDGGALDLFTYGVVEVCFVFSSFLLF